MLTDKQIYICQLGSLEPLRHFAGHEDEVNAIKWESSGTYLASCSDDHTAKIWSIDQDTPVWDLVGIERRSIQCDGAHLLQTRADFFLRLHHSIARLEFGMSTMARCVFLWSMKDGTLLKTHRGNGGVLRLAGTTQVIVLQHVTRTPRSIYFLYDLNSTHIGVAVQYATIIVFFCPTGYPNSAMWDKNQPSQASVGMKNNNNGWDVDSNKSSVTDAASGEDASSTVDQETEVLDEEPRSIMMGIISQLSKGMDLHRVTLPTFVLEPRSMCERISDFVAHQDTMFRHHSKKEDPLERFIDVLRYFLSGWHTRPKGVKKPFNPVLGEFFRCSWNFPDNTESFFVCEQVLHHPPVSAYLFASPENDIIITGELKPKLGS
ncbi:hypothetical protein BASA83_008817 [Batrachochytrium salamandrivorans]|nr:hypothetical protein BASA83_008817 [Batrachochytrium salamandrivorans]